MSSLPVNYQQIVSSLKDKIRDARLNASLTVNKELLAVYWEIGTTILQQQKAEGWGAKIIDRLSADLRTEFPDFKGLSVRNLKYMRAFAEAYPALEIMQHNAAQIQSVGLQEIVIVQQAAAQLPWGHHQIILDKVKQPEERLFYMQKCIENGWSRNILTEQINSKLFERQGNAITNFRETLPQLQSDLARETLKNPYIFDFLHLGEEVKERELENALIQHLKAFMLELGKGFAYVGRQKNLVVQGDDFFLDLLFYNYNLHCFVVIELKVGEFKPEYAGKLNFYVNTINDQLKGSADQPTIGILLCKTPNETVVRFSLQGIESPIGVADYQLAQALPKQLKSEMPTIEELEAEIDKEYEELKNPAEKKWDTLKQKLATLNTPRVQVPVSHDALCQIFDQTLTPLFTQLLERLKTFHGEFMSASYFWTGVNNITDFEMLEPFWKNEQFLRTHRELYFHYRLNGLKALGLDTFDEVIQLNYLIHHPYWYGFSIANQNNNQPFIRKLYSEQLTPSDIDLICDTVCNTIVEDIERRIGYVEEAKTRNQ